MSLSICLYDSIQTLVAYIHGDSYYMLMGAPTFLLFDHLGMILYNNPLIPITPGHWAPYFTS